MFILRVSQYGEYAITIAVFSETTTMSQVLQFVNELNIAVKDINNLQELEKLNATQEKTLNFNKKFIGERTGESDINETTRFSFNEVRTVQP